MKYMICTNPRSGSTLVSKALEATGAAGRPGEWFNQYAGKDYTVSPPLGARNWRDYLDNVYVRGLTPGGIYGIKCLYMHIEQTMWRFKNIPDFYELSPFDFVHKIFGDMRFIRLKRRDLTAQAVSYYIADKTGMWHENSREPNAPFDYAHIKRLKDLLVGYEECWDKFLDGREHMMLYYEDVAADYTGSIKAILKYLDINYSGVIMPPPLEKQSGELSKKLIQQFNLAKGD